MMFPSKGIVKRTREKYPAGTRVELVKMDDIHAPPVGTHGTVTGIDDTGSLLLNWDHGCGLNVIYGVDLVVKLDTVTTICCGEKKMWDSRKEAADYFLQAIAGSEGAECERYTTIYAKLVSGEKICSDDAS